MNVKKELLHYINSCVPLILIVFFSIIYAYISVIKHQHFQSFAWDLAFFDQLIWKVYQGIPPISSFGGLHILGDHFQPILYPFALLYFIKSDVGVLLSMQAAIGVFGAVPIYLLARRLLKSYVLASAVLCSFLLFTAFQHAILDGFHQSVIAASIIGWIFYFLETRQRPGYWISIGILLSVKEEYALLVAILGLITTLHYKRTRDGIITMLLGGIFFFAAIYVFIPHFQSRYTHFGYGSLGNTPLDVLKNSVLHPGTVISLLLTPTVKLQTVFATFFSFGFIPLLSPMYLLPILQQFFVRFVDTVTVHRWTNLNHYAFPLVPLTSVALIYGLQKLQRFHFKNSWLAAYVIFFALFQNMLHHGPINAIFKPYFYQEALWEVDVQELLKQVPPTVVISSQNSLLPHLSQRNHFYLLPEVGDAEYIAVDLRDGPNKYSPTNHSLLEAQIAELLSQQQFSIVWKQNESMLLQRTLVAGPGVAPGLGDYEPPVQLYTTPRETHSITKLAPSFNLW